MQKGVSQISGKFRRAHGSSGVKIHLKDIKKGNCRENIRQKGDVSLYVKKHLNPTTPENNKNFLFYYKEMDLERTCHFGRTMVDEFVMS